MNGYHFKLTMHLTKIREFIIRSSISACLIIIALGSSCQNNKNQSISGDKNDLLEITTTVFKSGTGWGYKVYVGGNIYINQPFIPGVPGKRYFKTEDDAQKVAMLVVEKIEQHHLPPTVSGNELRQLHIIE